MDIKEEVKKLPDFCGVYIMKSRRGRVLYVGKANSLKKRVDSYFRVNISEKNRLLMDKVKKIEYIKCESPEQALILEAALIKEKKPKYNISLKDSKSYPYLAITQEKYPRIFILRPKEKKGYSLFGPYTDTSSLKKALRVIRKIFPYCSCYPARKKRLCLYNHLELCPGPCTGKITAARYNENIEGIKKILKGKRPELIFIYRKKMEKLASLRRFEEAAYLRNKIHALENIYSYQPKTHELIDLKRALGLPRLPLLIEAVDISALGKESAVGSVVVFRDAAFARKEYRRFLIERVKGIDDCARVAEVVFRRYRRQKKEKKPLPDLLLVDGGRGQIMSAKRCLDKLNLSFSLVGLAKKNEEIWLPGEPRPLILPKTSSALHLLQQVRDEAHRFARSYHLLLRRRKTAKKKKR